MLGISQKVNYVREGFFITPFALMKVPIKAFQYMSWIKGKLEIAEKEAQQVLILF